MDSCLECGRPYGVRRRCYFCHGRSRTGEVRECAECGTPFYAPRAVLLDVERKSGTYCSRECKNVGTAKKQIMPLAQRASYVNNQGYMMVPFSSGRGGNRFRAEHRLVMDAALGRTL